MRLLPQAASFAALLLLATASARGGEPLSADDLAFCENKVRPALVKHCYECHSAEAKEIGGKLLLDTREGARAGGETGPALVPGKPEESLLVQALRYESLEMPPEKPLPEAIIHDLAEWIRRGAPDPRDAAAAQPAQAAAAETGVELWSLQPVQNPAPP